MSTFTWIKRSLTLYISLVLLAMLHNRITLQSLDRFQLSSIVIRRGDSLNSLLEQYRTISNHEIWSVKMISKSHPFVFLHQRKAGGTSLRHSLSIVANRTGINSFIPCYNGVVCETFEIPSDFKHDMYALHTNWNNLTPLIHDSLPFSSAYHSEINNKHEIAVSSIQQNINHLRGPVKNQAIPGISGNVSSAGKNTEISSTNSNSTFVHSGDDFVSTHFSCLTNFRDPISRLSSCVYFRFKSFFEQRRLSCINDINIADFTALLVERLDVYGNSCLNEPFRIFSGLTDERRITRLGFDYNNRTKQVHVRVRRNALDIKAMRQTLRHLSHCVPIVLELPESRKLLKYTFPSLYQEHVFDSSTRIQIHYQYSNNCTAPDPAHLRVMRIVTSMERLLYDAVVAKVESAWIELQSQL